VEKITSKQLPILLEKSQSLRTTLEALLKQNKWNEERLEEPRRHLKQAKADHAKENQLETNTQNLQKQVEQLKMEIEELKNI